jgi:hypothetical protein
MSLWDEAIYKKGEFLGEKFQMIRSLNPSAVLDDNSIDKYVVYVVEYILNFE